MQWMPAFLTASAWGSVEHTCIRRSSTARRKLELPYIGEPASRDYPKPVWNWGRAQSRAAGLSAPTGKIRECANGPDWIAPGASHYGLAFAATIELNRGRIA